MGTDVSTELAAMQAVGNALAQLPDNQSRVRVLRWATDHVRRSEARVHPGMRLHLVPAPEPEAARPAPQASEDPIVAIDGLADLFPSLGVHIRQNRERDDLSFNGWEDTDSEPASAEPLDALIRTLAEDLGQFAIAWQHA